MNLDARVRKRSTVRASHALARRSSIQQAEELIVKQLNETDSNHTVTRISEQVDGGTYVDGTHRESLPLPVCLYINTVPTPPSTAARTESSVDRIVIGVVTEDVVKGKESLGG